MAKTKIEWTHRPRRDGTFMPGYTYNTHWGCWKVSPACAHCYAETWAIRVGMADLWTKDGPRRFFGDGHWNEPLKWDAGAAALGEMHAVFCASMADIGEDRRDLDPVRGRLFDLILRTPHLLWLLVTKRPDVLRQAMPWKPGRGPRNVWLGVTVEAPAYLWRVEEALRAEAARTFISYEPAVAPVDFRPVLGPGRDRASWLIIGTESGANARPMRPEWAVDAVEACRSLGAHAFVKQVDAELLQLGRRGEPIKSLAHFPPALRVREWPSVEAA